MKCWKIPVLVVNDLTNSASGVIGIWHAASAAKITDNVVTNSIGVRDNGKSELRISMHLNQHNPMSQVCPFENLKNDLCLHENLVLRGSMAETMKGLQLLEENVMEIREHEGHDFSAMSQQVDHVLQEICQLRQEVESHRRIQDNRWKLLQSMKLLEPGTLERCNKITI